MIWRFYGIKILRHAGTYVVGAVFYSGLTEWNSCNIVIISLLVRIQLDGALVLDAGR